MNLSKAKLSVLSLTLIISLFGSASAINLDGTVRVGHVFVGDEGDRSVDQGSFNLYKGVALSLENLRYRATNGVRVNGDFRNVTLNNRNLSLGITKSSAFGITLRNSQYRRVYSSEGDSFTRRNRTAANLWIQPHKYVRLYGGYGLTNKKGQQLELFEPGTEVGRDNVDYNHTFYNAGVRFKYQRYQLNVAYRGSSFNDNNFPNNDRTSGRLEITSAAPIPWLPQLFINAGYQNFQTKIKDRHDTLKANTVWGGFRYFGPYQTSLRSNLIFDRARRTGDLSATDNIAYSVHAGKNWQRYAGIVVGYKHRINDDVLDALNATGYSVSLWGRPFTKLLLKADYGNDTKEVTSGRTLTGDRDYSRFSGSVRYSFGMGSYARVKHSSRKTENKDIGSSADFTQIGLELVWHSQEYGEAQFSYSLLNGEYVNTNGEFTFKDHLLSGDLLSPVYHNLQAGFGATYMRGKEDIDIESSQLRFTGFCTFLENHQLALTYRVLNYDDFGDDSPIYSKYYTANIVEISVAKQL